MNRKGFTLIELLAVVIILGVIMTIAVPNVLSMLDRNKKDTFIENAKTMVTQAEYTLRSNTDIEYPSTDKAIILTLEYLNTNDVSSSPYDTEYSPTRSFVAIVNETKDEITEYKYYVHLVACSDINCANTEENSVNKNRGINLVSSESLSGGDRFNLVEQGPDVNTGLGIVESSGTMANESEVLSIIGASAIEKVFYKLS